MKVDKIRVILLEQGYMVYLDHINKYNFINTSYASYLPRQRREKYLLVFINVSLVLST